MKENDEKKIEEIKTVASGIQGKKDTDTLQKGLLSVLSQIADLRENAIESGLVTEELNRIQQAAKENQTEALKLHTEGKIFRDLEPWEIAQNEKTRNDK